jgi:hypothetical protein
VKKSTIIVALVLVLGLSHASLSPAATTRVPALRHAIAWHRAQTWRWQDLAGVPRAPTAHVERRSRSVPFLRWVARLWSGRRVAAHRRFAALASQSVPAIICRVFGAARCAEAQAIARRESGFSTNPQPPNPTHFGIFQLDAPAVAAYARGRYRTALDQVRAAFRMFLARGWEPWTCCEG